MDRLSAQQRSTLMSRVRSRDTGPELRVRKAAHALGLRYRLQRRDLPGTPDLVFPKHRVAILVHGCFWHRHPDCKRASIPKSKVDFWQRKFDGNVQRDNLAVAALKESGWRAEVLWECETKCPKRLQQRLEAIFLDRNSNAARPVQVS
jgi:DNA mismatch endonuclease, patch repair protein